MVGVPSLKLFASKDELVAEYTWQGDSWQVDVPDHPVAKITRMQLLFSDGTLLLDVPCIASEHTIATPYPYDPKKHRESDGFAAEEVKPGENLNGFTFALFLRVYARQSQRGPMMVMRPTLLTDGKAPRLRCSWFSPERQGLNRDIDLTVREEESEGDYRQRILKDFQENFRVPPFPVASAIEPQLLKLLSNDLKSSNTKLSIFTEGAKLVIAHHWRQAAPLGIERFPTSTSIVPAQTLVLRGQEDYELLQVTDNFSAPWSLRLQAPASLDFLKVNESYFRPVRVALNTVSANQRLSALPQSTQDKQALQGRAFLEWNLTGASEPGVFLDGAVVRSNPFDLSKLPIGFHQVDFDSKTPLSSIPIGSRSKGKPLLPQSSLLSGGAGCRRPFLACGYTLSWRSPGLRVARWVDSF